MYSERCSWCVSLCDVVVEIVLFCLSSIRNTWVLIGGEWCGLSEETSFHDVSLYVSVVNIRVVTERPRKEGRAKNFGENC